MPAQNDPDSQKRRRPPRTGRLDEAELVRIAAFRLRELKGQLADLERRARSADVRTMLSDVRRVIQRQERAIKEMLK